MNSNSWHFDQLRKELKHNEPFRTDRIELINPDIIKWLDGRLMDDFWHPITATVEDSRFIIPDDCLKNGKPEIENRCNSLPHRSFTVILEDPVKPAHPDNTLRNWFARIKVDAITDHFYTELEYFLYFPEFFEFEKILNLMSRPEFQTMPPELSWSQGMPETGNTFSLKFIFGSGSSWAYYPDEEFTAVTVKKIKSLLSLVDTSETAAMDLFEDHRMKQLEDKLIQVWELWVEQ